MKEKKDERIPITLENLHELISKIPPEVFEKARKKREQDMAKSRKFWEDRDNGKR
ncbi:hypothetical protein [Lactobacillus corticis]|uniref:Uncharacterized protein n=1 Tax=Lactobacillus corticis TaxID=2201249 RepID=A0A916VIY9_9LACO|nr:hypothetical protein [Lactobacillus corticis]GFZ26624.1 hypothetical protein LCB40_05040 [Lactobacillus corticis]